MKYIPDPIAVADYMKTLIDGHVSGDSTDETPSTSTTHAISNENGSDKGNNF